MKKILVPMDFSECSKNATNYAVELAHQLKAELILFHVLDEPVIGHSSVVTQQLTQKIEHAAVLQLNETRKSIQTKYPDQEVKEHIIAGIPIYEINLLAQKEQVSYIVLGFHGVGFVEEKILGSTASSLIHDNKIPVIVIGENVKFKPVKNIVLASDFHQINTTVLSPLKYLLKSFKAELSILNIYTEDAVVPSIGEIVASFDLDHTFKFITHTFFYTKDDDIVHGINDFSEKKNMDMIAMISHKHHFFHRIFKGSFNKKMIFQSNLPFLSLPE